MSHFSKENSGTFKLFAGGHTELELKVSYHRDMLSKE